MHGCVSGWLTNQWTLPNAKEDFFELVEIPGAELGDPIALDVAQDVDGLGIGGVAAFGKADDARAALMGSVGSEQISEFLKAAQQTVHGLLAYTGTLGENAGANPIGAGKAEERHVRQAEPLEARRVEFTNDPAVNSLGGSAQQRPDEHIPRRDRLRRQIFFKNSH